MTQQSQTAVGNLKTRCMLVDLTIKQWSARKTDRKASDEVAAAHGSDATMGRYWKNLLSPERMEPLRKLATRAQADHRARTLPWQDSGARILLAAGYPDYSRVMRAYKDEFDALVLDWLRDYDAARDEARLKLNGLFNPNDYPPAYKIQSKFTFQVDPLGFPTAEDFRTDVGDEAAEVIREKIRANERAIVQRAMGDVWTRVQDVLDSMTERLHAYKINDQGKAEGVFRDSLVQNVRDLVDLLPTLNLADDPKLDEVTEAMRAKLCKHDADVLRDSPIVREQVRDAADEILSKVHEFGFA